MTAGDPAADDRIRFFCFHCFHPVNAPARFVGRLGECQNCGKKTQIPAVSTREKTVNRQVAQASALPASKALPAPPVMAAQPIDDLLSLEDSNSPATRGAVAQEASEEWADASVEPAGEDEDADIPQSPVLRAPAAGATSGAAEDRVEVVGVIDDQKARKWKSIFAGKNGEAGDLNDESAGGLPEID